MKANHLRKRSNEQPAVSAASFEQDGKLTASESVLLLGAFFTLAVSLASFATL
jgi:hypothetical protein